MPAPKKLHKALDDVWDTREKLKRLKEMADNFDATVAQKSEAAKAVRAAYDKFEEMLNR